MLCFSCVLLRPTKCYGVEWLFQQLKVIIKISGSCSWGKDRSGEDTTSELHILLENKFVDVEFFLLYLKNKAGCLVCHYRGIMGKKQFYFLCIILSVVCGLSFFPILKTVHEIGPFSQGAVQLSSHKIPLSCILQYKFFERPFTPDQNKALINEHVSWNDFSGNTVHFGYQRGYLGLKLLLKNESDLPVTALFEIGWPFLNNLHFYSLSVDELTFARSASVAFTSQPMADYRHPVYRLDFAPGNPGRFIWGLKLPSSLSSQ